MRMLMRTVAVLALSGGIAAARPAPPERRAMPSATREVRLAQASVSQCTATEILATNEKQGIDPKLERLKAKLTRPPFSAWDTFKLLGEQSIRAEKDRPASARLANGGSVTLLFKDKLVVQGGKPRLRFGIDLDSAEGKRTVSTVVVIDSGDSLLFAGEPYKSGTYILALTCTAQ